MSAKTQNHACPATGTPSPPLPPAVAALRLAVERHGGASKVARQAGVGRSTLYRALRGEPISGSNARKLARMLGAPLDLFALR